MTFLLGRSFEAGRTAFRRRNESCKSFLRRCSAAALRERAVSGHKEEGSNRYNTYVELTYARATIGGLGRRGASCCMGSVGKTTISSAVKRPSGGTLSCITHASSIGPALLFATVLSGCSSSPSPSAPAGWSKVVQPSENVSDPSSSGDAAKPRPIPRWNGCWVGG